MSAELPEVTIPVRERIVEKDRSWNWKQLGCLAVLLLLFACCAVTYLVPMALNNLADAVAERMEPTQETPDNTGSNTASSTNNRNNGNTGSNTSNNTNNSSTGSNTTTGTGDNGGGNNNQNTPRSAREINPIGVGGSVNGDVVVFSVWCDASAPLGQQPEFVIVVEGGAALQPGCNGSAWIYSLSQYTLAEVVAEAQGHGSRKGFPVMGAGLTFDDTVWGRYFR